MQSQYIVARKRREQGLREDEMERGQTPIFDLVYRMLELLEPAGYDVQEGQTGLVVSIAGLKITFDLSLGSLGLAFEQLAGAIEARIAFERTRRMLAAADVLEDQPPLWVVSGPSVLAQWLTWSRTSKALRKSLALTDRWGRAPIEGGIARRARRQLGQGGSTIRVCNGMAVAERIELAEHPKTVAVMGDSACIIIGKQSLPETLVMALSDSAPTYEGRRLAEIIDHPFIADADLKLVDIHNEAADVVIEVETHWGPLEPIPAASLDVLPADADPAFPWRATAREVAQLDELVKTGDQCAEATAGLV